MKIGRPLKWKTPEDFKKAVDSYFTYSESNKKPISKSGLAVYLKTSRRLLLNYQERKGYAEIIEFAESRIENYLVNRVLTEKNIGGPIFILKACHGFSETQKFEHDGVLEVRITKFADGSNPPK